MATGKKRTHKKRMHGMEGDILKKIPDDSLMVFPGECSFLQWRLAPCITH